MKTLEYFLGLAYKLEILPDTKEGGYIASYPELPGCITSGKTIKEAVENAMDAKKAWLEAALEDGTEIEEPDSMKRYSGQFKLRMPKSLHRSLVEHAREEGISLNQYCVYLLSKNDVTEKERRRGSSVEK